MSADIAVRVTRRYSLPPASSTFVAFVGQPPPQVAGQIADHQFRPVRAHALFVRLDDAVGGHEAMKGRKDFHVRPRERLPGTSLFRIARLACNIRDSSLSISGFVLNS